MTPEKLRLIAAYYRERDNVGDEGIADEFEAAASAWEAERQLHTLTDQCWKEDIETLAAADTRIEELERELQDRCAALDAIEDGKSVDYFMAALSETNGMLYEARAHIEELKQLVARLRVHLGDADKLLSS